MITLLLCYIIGKFYQELAVENNRNGWIYAVLGAVIYYAGIFVGGILLVLLIEVISPGAIVDFDKMLLEVMCIPLGIIAALVTYKILKKRFKENLEGNGSNFKSDILDDGLF